MLASDIQLSEVSLQTVEQYSHCKLHDRQVVLQALLQQRLSAVLACPLDAHETGLKEESNSSGVCEAASQHSNTAQDIAAGLPVDQSASSSHASHEGQQECPQGSSRPVSCSETPALRSWGSTWLGTENKQIPMWRSSVTNATDSSQSASVTAPHSHELHQQIPAGGHSSTMSSGTQACASPQPRSPTTASQPHSPTTAPQAPAASGPGAANPQQDAHNAIDGTATPSGSASNGAVAPLQQPAAFLDRSVICAHPMATTERPLLVLRDREPTDTQHSPSVDAAAPQQPLQQPPPPRVSIPAKLPPMQEATLKSDHVRESMGSFSPQPDSRAFLAHPAVAPAFPNTVASTHSSVSFAHPPEHYSTFRDNGIGTAEHPPPSAHEALSSTTTHLTGVPGMHVPHGSSSGKRQESSDETLIRACLPFKESDSWYCTQLFGPQGGSVEHTPLEASLNPMSQDRSPTGVMHYQ